MHWGFINPNIFFSGSMVSVFEKKIEMDFGYKRKSIEKNHQLSETNGYSRNEC